MARRVYLDLCANLEPINIRDLGGGTYFSASLCPWLQVRFVNGLPAGRWIEIKYSASLYDEGIRPMIRFRTPKADRMELLPAALWGYGTWTGFVDAATIEIHICPVNRSGYFGFRLDAFVTLPFAWVVGRTLVNHPLAATQSIFLVCRGLTARARALLQIAMRCHPLKSYDGWRKKRIRDLEMLGLELPRTDWRDGPHIRIVIALKGENVEAALTATLMSLRQQVYPNWSVAVVSDDPKVLAEANRVLASAGRHAVYVRPSAPISVLWKDLVGQVLVAPVSAGSIVPPFALAVVAEYSISNPQYEIIYGDEDEIDSRGRFHTPLLKPDWSPTFQRSAPYVGRAIYVRPVILSDREGACSCEIASDSLLIREALLKSNQVGHLRRILLSSTTPEMRSTTLDPWVGRVKLAHSRNASRPLLATIVIPTKDRAELLRACLKSIALTQLQNFEIVIIDNGSGEAETFILYDQLKGDPHVRIEYSPGPFNFSALCNAAVATAKGSVVVFLNNDSVVLTADWLEKLTSWALRSDVGAVGTKLIYPSGLLQHTGVVIGLGGYAAHIDRGTKAARSGYMRKLTASREVSAVTAACLAIEKVKFNAIGGFDARTFPVELNDIDLCLRLGAAGWRTVCLHDPTIVHHESATRGTTKDLDVVYGYERRNFYERWHSLIRDDPYFHPALSLHSTETALDQ